jgi:membrane-bound serine protease (ClpP class)
MILGAMMLVDSPAPALRVDVWRLMPVILAFAFFVGALVRLVIQSQRRKPATGSEGLVGARGRADAAFPAGEGWVIVQGERWKASAGEPIAAGDPVIVVSMDEGLVLRVRKGA